MTQLHTPVYDFEGSRYQRFCFPPMGMFSEFCEKVLRRFQRQRSTSRQSSLKRTQSLPREHKDRTTIVLRPRSNTTEVTIERRRVSRGTDWNKINRSMDASKQEAQSEVSRKREKMMIRTDSGSGKTHLTVVAKSGSILAPTYRSRAASVKNSSVVTISI